MQQSQQEVKNYREDGIDLRLLFNSLVARKFLILGLTAFITAHTYTQLL
jgi:LPS O-antigen subunit length determinant protein (WzzB/FepE family)